MREVWKRRSLSTGPKCATWQGLRAEAIVTRIAKRYLDDANAFPLGDAWIVDLRLERGFRRVRARIDLANLTATRYNQVGLALPDFRGSETPYFFPAPALAARLGIDWRP